MKQAGLWEPEERHFEMLGADTGAWPEGTRFISRKGSLLGLASYSFLPASP